MKVRIHSIAELIEFIKDTDLTPYQLKTLLAKGYHFYIFGNEPKNEIVSFLEKYKDSECLPLFMADLKINN